MKDQSAVAGGCADVEVGRRTTGVVRRRRFLQRELCVGETFVIGGMLVCCDGGFCLCSVQGLVKE